MFTVSQQCNYRVTKCTNKFFKIYQQFADIYCSMFLVFWSLHWDYCTHFCTVQPKTARPLIACIDSLIYTLLHMCQNKVHHYGSYCISELWSWLILHLSFWTKKTDDNGHVSIQHLTTFYSNKSKSPSILYYKLFNVSLHGFHRLHI